jgi:hypothetical protein
MGRRSMETHRSTARRYMETRRSMGRRYMEMRRSMGRRYMEMHRALHFISKTYHWTLTDRIIMMASRTHSTTPVQSNTHLVLVPLSIQSPLHPFLDGSRMLLTRALVS